VIDGETADTECDCELVKINLKASVNPLTHIVAIWVQL